MGDKHEMRENFEQGLEKAKEKLMETERNLKVKRLQKREIQLHINQLEKHENDHEKATQSMTKDRGMNHGGFMHERRLETVWQGDQTQRFEPHGDGFVRDIGEG